MVNHDRQASLSFNQHLVLLQTTSHPTTDPYKNMYPPSIKADLSHYLSHAAIVIAHKVQSASGLRQTHTLYIIIGGRLGRCSCVDGNTGGNIFPFEVVLVGLRIVAEQLTDVCYQSFGIAGVSENGVLHLLHGTGMAVTLHVRSLVEVFAKDSVAAFTQLSDR